MFRLLTLSSKCPSTQPFFNGGAGCGTVCVFALAAICQNAWGGGGWKTNKFSKDGFPWKWYNPSTWTVLSTALLHG